MLNRVGLGFQDGTEMHMETLIKWGAGRMTWRGSGAVRRRPGVGERALMGAGTGAEGGGGSG